MVTRPSVSLSEWDSCMCPLCLLYKSSKTRFRRWAVSRYETLKASLDAKLATHRDENEATLKKLRDKHACQLSAFDATIREEEADFERQYTDEVGAMNAAFVAQVTSFLAQCRSDYAGRLRGLDGFVSATESEIATETESVSETESATGSESVDPDRSPFRLVVRDEQLVVVSTTAAQAT